VNPQWVLDAARDFRIASQMLGAQFGQTYWPLRSTVMCAAFSAELYLKYLAVGTTGDLEREHDLRKLYDALPEGVRILVATKYQGQRPLLDVLSEHRATFVEWRYIFEKQSGAFGLDCNSLIALCSALDAAASVVHAESKRGP